jgi:hypothetical protein
VWGALLRAAGGFAAAMLIGSALKEVLDPFVLPMLKDSLGQSSLLYTSLSAVLQWLPFIALFALVLGLVARGIAEDSLPGV